MLTVAVVFLARSQRLVKKLKVPVIQAEIKSFESRFSTETVPIPVLERSSVPVAVPPTPEFADFQQRAKEDAASVIQKYWRKYKSIHSKYMARRTRRVRLFRNTRSNTKTFSPALKSPILTPDTPPLDRSFSRSMISTGHGDDLPSISETIRSLEANLERLAKRWLTPQKDLGSLEK